MTSLSGPAGSPQSVPCGKKPRRFGIYTEFDEASSPVAFAALSKVPSGKARARRMRELVLTGLNFELMAGRASGPAAPVGETPDGAHGVFDDPVPE